MSSSLQRVLAAPVRDEVPALASSCTASALRIAADLARPWPLALAVDYALADPPVATSVAWATPELVLVAAGVATVLVSACGPVAVRRDAGLFGSRTATRAGVLEAGRAAGIDEFATRLPLGYDEPLGEGAQRLSGGQRRRVAIARAAISSAPVLLLDEPTASLDARSAEHVITAIRAAAGTRTTVIVTHDPVLASVADRVVEMSPPPPVSSPPVREGGESDAAHPSDQGPDPGRAPGPRSQPEPQPLPVPQPQPLA